MKTAKFFKRALLPISAFCAVVVIHYLWLALFPATDPAQNEWVTVESVENISWFGNYIKAQDYFLTFAYAYSIAFAVWSIRRYKESRGARTLGAAIGGITFSGLLAFFGCYLVGCCGSPMLVVWLNLLGAKFLPFAKPLMAAITFISVTIAWALISRRKQCSDTSCGCQER